MDAARLAAAILDCCLRGQPVPESSLRTLVEADSPALFQVIVEGLGDRFEPALCDAYAALFSQVIAWSWPGESAERLVHRYHDIRRPRAVPDVDPPEVVVLSRVTLGADLAITSTILDAVRKRFPGAALLFAGPLKNYELFAADPRLRHLPCEYPRSASLRERLTAAARLRATLAGRDVMVFDPDSRLTQLGLLPIVDDERYFFFESRSYGGSGGASLGELTRRWVAETLGIADARPYLAPVETAGAAGFTISLGVGGNMAKRVGGGFEHGLVQNLARRGEVLIDRGAGGEEAERVRRAIGAAAVRTWDGAFAPFAASIAASRGYAGYDSAGQHAAAVAGVPLLTVFAGAVSDRFFARWRPCGPGPIEVVRVSGRDSPESVLTSTLAAIERLWGTL